jgi:hypothetical protein
MDDGNGELAVVDNTTAPSINTSELSFADVDGAKRFMENYQELVEALLDESDYQNIAGKNAKKKSAWRKLATAFNVSDDIIHHEETRDETGQIVSAKFFVKATLPNGRSSVGIGECSIYSKIRYAPTKKFEADTETPSNFELRGRFSDAEHVIPATAHTRAKSRAIADLIGAGEVSAEEFDDGPVKVSRTSRNNTDKNVQADDKPKTRGRSRSRRKASKPADEAIETKAEVVVEEESSTTDNFTRLAENNTSIHKAIQKLDESDEKINKGNIIDELFGLYDMGTITEDEYFEAKSQLETS